MNDNSDDDELIYAAETLFEFYVLRHEDICSFIHSKRQRIFAVMILSSLLSGEKKESDIRKKYGNTPDVSKALRHLISMKYIKRSGKGGRLSPFIYEYI